jgi:hypothetical protein
MALLTVCFIWPVHRRGQHAAFAPAPLPPLREALSDAVDAAREAELTDSPTSHAVFAADAPSPGGSAAGGAAAAGWAQGRPEAAHAEALGPGAADPEAMSPAMAATPEAAAPQMAPPSLPPPPSPPASSADALDRLSQALRF